MDTHNNTLFIRFEKALREKCGVSEGMHVLAAVSGGADSVALLHLLCRAKERMGIQVTAAHFDHQLRGEASSGDARFVRQLCEALDVPLREGTGDVRELARTRKKGLEEAARSARYAFLQAQAEQIGAQAIALAHHRDDQAETLLLHAVRGCDVRGLGAMHYRSRNLIRPLLGVEKAELEAWLKLLGQDFRTDESNFCIDADRNRIRLQVIPQLREVNVGVSAAFSRLALSAQRDEAYFEAEIEKLGLEPLVSMPYGGFVKTQPIEGLPDALLSRVILHYAQQTNVPDISALDIEKIMCLIREGEGRTQLSGGVRLIRAKERLHFEWKTALAGDETASLVLEGVTRCGAWRIEAREALPGERGDGIFTQVLDAHRLKGAVLRTCRNGDVFSPLGMTGSQKLKKTFADAGIEQPLRAYVPLIALENRVLWMIGVKAGRDAAITDATERGIHLAFTGAWMYNQKINRE